MSARIEVEMRILIIEPNESSAARLRNGFAKCRWVEWIVMSHVVTTLTDAVTALDKTHFNTIFINLLAFNAEDAARFIFSIREHLPAVVFVLYWDEDTAKDAERILYVGERKRLLHYYVQTKISDELKFMQELETNLVRCMSDMRVNASALRTKLRLDLSNGRLQPPQLTDSLRQFRTKFPSDGSAVGFLMMSYGEGKTLSRITWNIKEEFAQSGLTIVRADDFDFHPQLLDNILTYIHGCDFGVAVVERIEDEHHNPNVALEVGYMMALGKPICFLREKNLRALQTDLLGLLTIQFEVDKMRTMRQAIRQWIRRQTFLNEMNNTKSGTRESANG
jgi:hypothetical protein